MGTNVIMVASGKGGTGKSTLAVLLGAELAARGKRVLLVELDCGMRSVDYIAGVCGKTVYDIEDVLTGRCEAGKAIVESPVYRDLYLISAPYSGGRIRPAALRVFVEKAGELEADIICMSAMLTTTMPEMRKVIGRLVNLRVRERYIVMVGGAPVTEVFAKRIGADLYTRDAGMAALAAKETLQERKQELRR